MTFPTYPFHLFVNGPSFGLWYATKFTLWYTGTMPLLWQTMNSIDTVIGVTCLASATIGALWFAKDWLREDTCMRQVRQATEATESGQKEGSSYLITHLFFGGFLGFLAPLICLRVGYALCRAGIAILFFPHGSYAASVRLYYPDRQSEKIHGWNGKRWMTLNVSVKSRWGFNEYFAHPDVLKQLQGDDKVD